MFTTSKAGRELITRFEGCKLKAYTCSAGKATIGYGNTYFEDGTPVKLCDTITPQRAEELFSLILTEYEKAVNTLVKTELNQNQFDALVSFAYNCGIGNLKASTLLKKVNANPNDPTIRAEFLKWNKAAGKIRKGLTNRRTAEADLYFI